MAESLRDEIDAYARRTKLSPMQMGESGPDYRQRLANEDELAAREQQKQNEAAERVARANEQAAKQAEAQRRSDIRKNEAHLTDQIKEQTSLIDDAPKKRAKLEGELQGIESNWKADETKATKRTWLGLGPDPTPEAVEAQGRIAVHKSAWNTKKAEIDALDAETEKATKDRTELEQHRQPYSTAVTDLDAQEFAEREARLMGPNATTQPPTATQAPAGTPQAPAAPTATGNQAASSGSWFKIPAATPGGRNPNIPSGPQSPGSTQGAQPAPGVSSSASSSQGTSQQPDSRQPDPIPKTFDKSKWDDADRAAFKALPVPEKRKFTQAAINDRLQNEILTKRRQIIDRKGDVARFDADQSAMSEDRKRIIEAVQGEKPLDFWGALMDELGGRSKTAAAAAGQAYASVGTGLLDLATAAQSAFGRDPDETWTHQYAEGVRQFYESGQDEKYRDAVATRLTSGLASAHSFMAPGGILGKALGGSTKAITAASAITGAIVNGGSAYSEALDMGMTKEQSFARLAVGMGLGTTEAIGVGGILGKLDRMSRGGLSKFFVNLAKQGFEEGAQEAFQSAGQDVADLLILGPKDPRAKSLEKIKADAIENGLWGAATGILFTGLVDGIQRRDFRNRATQLDGDIETLRGTANQIDTSEGYAKAAESLTQREIASYKGDIEKDMAGFSVQDGAFPMSASDPLAVLVAKRDTLAAVDRSGMDSARVEAIDGAQQQLDGLIEARTTTPEQIAIAAELTIGQQGNIARAESTIQQAEGELTLETDESFANPVDWHARLETRQKLRGALSDKIIAARGEATEKDGRRLVAALPVAKEVSRYPDVPADPNQNGKLNGSSQRQIAMAVARVASGQILSEADLNLRSGNVNSPGAIFQKDKATGRVTIKNPETLAALEKDSPLLAQAYKDYETRSLQQQMQSGGKDTPTGTKDKGPSTERPTNGGRRVQPDGTPTVQPGAGVTYQIPVSQRGAQPRVIEFTAANDNDAREMLSDGRAFEASPLQPGETFDLGQMRQAPVQPASQTSFAPQSPLTPAAEDLLTKIDAGDSAPAFISKNLEQIAAENGVTISGSMTPDDVVTALRAKRGTAQTSAPSSAPAPTPAADTRAAEQKYLPIVSPLSPFFQGFAFTNESLGSGGFVFSGGKLVISIPDAEKNLRSSSQARRVAIEEVIHSILTQAEEAGVINASEIFDALPDVLKKSMRAAYKAAAARDNAPWHLGHEFLRMVVQRKVRFSEDGTVTWTDAGGQLISEQSNPALLARLREALSALLKYLGDLPARLRRDGTSDAAINAIAQAEKTVRDAISQINKAQAAMPELNTPADLEGEKIDKEWTAFAPETRSLGIPRAEMPQIKAEARGALTQFLKARGITHEQEDVLPGTLHPTQAEYSQTKVDKAREFLGGDRAILVSSDDQVVDGHHQWLAKLTDKPNEPMRVIRLNAPIRELLPLIAEFPSTENAGGATTSSTTNEQPKPQQNPEAAPVEPPASQQSGTENAPEARAEDTSTREEPAGSVQPLTEDKEIDLARNLSPREWEAANLPVDELRDFIAGEHLDQRAGASRMPDRSLARLGEYFERTGAQEKADVVLDEIERRSYEEEAQTNEEAASEGLYDLLEATRLLGGIPISDDVLHGEIDLLRETPAAREVGLFNRRAGALDTLRSNLQDYGFDFATPAELLDALQQRLTSGKPIYGTTNALFSQAATLDEQAIGAGKLILQFQRTPDLQEGPVPTPTSEPSRALSPEQRRLVEENLGIAGWAAARYSNIEGLGEAREDILQEARLGLIDAARTFDSSKGYTFGTWAGTIITNRLNKKYRKALNKTNREGVSADAPISPDAEDSLVDLTPAPSERPRPDQDGLTIFRDLMSALPPREQSILASLAQGKDTRTIGGEVGLSHEGVRKASRKAAQWLREKLLEKNITSATDIFPADRMLASQGDSPRTELLDKMRKMIRRDGEIDLSDPMKWPNVPSQERLVYPDPDQGVKAFRPYLNDAEYEEVKPLFALFDKDEALTQDQNRRYWELYDKVEAAYGDRITALENKYGPEMLSAIQTLATEGLNVEPPANLAAMLGRNTSRSLASQADEDYEPSRVDPAEVGRHWLEVARHEKAFSLGPTPKSTNMQDILNQLAGPMAKEIRIVPVKDGNGKIYKYVFKDNAGGFIIFDMSAGFPHVNSFYAKKLGTPIYQTIYAFAHNNGLTVYEDPGGLSEEAQLRRTSQMLSSALRFGTTKHMRPAVPQDLQGWSNRGTPEATANNIGLLAMKEAELVFDRLPELRGYNYSDGSYYDDRGTRLPSNSVKLRNAAFNRRIMQIDRHFHERTGARTLARALATRRLEGPGGGLRNPLLQPDSSRPAAEENRADDGVLPEVVPGGPEGLPRSLERILYSQDDGNARAISQPSGERVGENLEGSEAQSPRDTDSAARYAANAGRARLWQRPEEAAVASRFEPVTHIPALRWGIRALADAFADRGQRGRTWAERMPLPVYRPDFKANADQYEWARRIAVETYRDTVGKVDTAYAEHPGQAGRMLPRTPQVRSLFALPHGGNLIDDLGEIQLSPGEPLFSQAPIDHAALDKLEAESLARAAGGRPIGDPRLAFSMDNEIWRAMDEWRKSQFQSQREAEWQAAAEIMLRENPQLVEDSLIEKGMTREILNPVETKAAQKLIAWLSTQPRTDENRRKIQTLIFAYRETGSAAGRAMTARRDPHKTPAQRWREYFARKIYTPPPRVQREVENAPSKRVLNIRIADLERRLSAAIAQSNAHERANIERDLATARETATKETILQSDYAERIKPLEEKLAKMGVSIDDILGGQVELRLMGAKIIRDVAADLDEKRRRVIAYIQNTRGGTSPEKISQKFSMPLREVRALYSEYREKLKAELVRRFESGINFDELETGGVERALLSQPAAERTRRSAEEAAVMAEKALRMMAFFKYEDLGRIKTRKGAGSSTTTPTGGPPWNRPMGPGQTLPDQRLDLRQVWEGQPQGDERYMPPSERGRLFQEGEAPMPTGEGKTTDTGRLDLGENWERPSGEGRITETGNFDLGEKPFDMTGDGRTGERQLFEEFETPWTGDVAYRIDPESEVDMLHLSRTIDTLQGGTWVDYATEFAIANLLSAPITAITNLTGYGYGAYELTVKRAIEAAVNRGKVPTGAQAGEFRHMLHALAPGIARAAANARVAWSTESPIFARDVLNTQVEMELNTQDERTIRAYIPGTFGRVVRIPFRVLLAADEFMKTVMGQMNAAGYAYRLAKSRGITGSGIGRFVTAQLAQKGSASWEWSVAEADRLSFQTPLRDWRTMQKTGEGNVIEAGLKWLQDVKNADTADLNLPQKLGSLALRAFFPFIRTPYRLVEAGLQNTLPGSLLDAVFSARDRKIKDEEGNIVGTIKADAAKKAAVRATVINAALWTALLAFVGEGDDDDDDKPILITGSRPMEDRSNTTGVRQLAYRTIPPYSVRIGNMVWSYQRIDPFSTMLATTVDALREFKETTRGKPAREAQSSIVAGIYSQLLDKASLRGFAELNDLLAGTTSPLEYGVQQLAAWTVPNAIRNPVRNSDQVFRDTRSEPLTPEAIAYQFLPLPSLAPPAKVDAYGRDVERPGNWLTRTFVPGMPGSSNEPHPIDLFAARYNLYHPSTKWAPATPPNKMQKGGQEREMTADEYNRFLALRGRIFSALARETGLLGKRQPTDEDKEKITQAGTKATREAKRVLFGAE